MSRVVGIDLSSKAIDLVALDEDTNRAEWVRCELEGKSAWERTVGLRSALLGSYGGWDEWWGDVYLVAIEAPYGSNQAGTQAILNRVVGAVAASLPARLRSPERCWIVRPDEWKTGLGLKGKPGLLDVSQISGAAANLDVPWTADQNARDAYCLAMWARDTNAEAVKATA